MSDYNNRIREWITNLVIEELREDEEWWNKMSADQQKDYIRQHPQSQKAMDAKKEKEKDSTLNVDSANAEEIEDWYDKNKDKITDEADREELSDMIRGLSVTAYDLEVANDEGDEYEEAEYLQNQIQDYKDDIKNLISKYDKKPSDDKPAKPNKDDIEDINNGSALDSFINKYDFSDEEEDELYKIQSDMDRGYTSPEGAQAKITRLLGLEKELSYTPPQVKQKVAGSADSREVRNNVMNRLGRDQFNKLSYGELQQAYDDEFERLGWKKDGKSWVKQESVVKSSLRLEEVVGKSLTEEQFDEAAGKKDACYHKVKARYDVWPSAYASGALVKCRKVGAKNWGNKSKKEGVNEDVYAIVDKYNDKKQDYDQVYFKDNNLNKVKKHMKKMGSKYGKMNLIRVKTNGKMSLIESVNELQKMRPAVKKLLKQKGYSPIFQAIDNSKRQFKQMRYSRGEIQDTLIDMFGDEDPKILQKIKESVNEKNYQMFPSKLVDMAVKIAKAMGGNMTGAVKKIEKMRKGLSQNGRVKYALRQANESYDIWMEDGSWGYTFKGLLPEAEYQGRKVKLGKPMQGDVKKFKVYVKNPKGNVVKVNFGQGGDAKGGTMKIRKSNPKARKSFRARHNCDNPGPRHKARYWSCRKW